MDKQNIINNLASNLRFLRINTKVERPITGKVKYMSQKDLAKLMGFTTQQVSKIELGKNMMSAIQIYTVSKIFDVSVDSMYGDLTRSVYNKTITQDA